MISPVDWTILHCLLLIRYYYTQWLLDTKIQQWLCLSEQRGFLAITGNQIIHHRLLCHL